MSTVSGTITAAASAQSAAELLATLFSKTARVYYSSTVITDTTLASGITYNFELPVIDESFKIDEGEPSTSEVKTTYQSNIVTKVSKGDGDCSMQIASASADALALFKTQSTNTYSVTFGSKTYTGSGFSGDVKKVTGALICVSDDGNSMIILPNVEMFGSIVTDDGDNPLYINVKMALKDNEDGVSIIPLTA